RIVAELYNLELRQFTTTKTPEHVDGPIEEISHSVCQAGVIKLDQSLFRKVGVFSDSHVGHQIIAHCRGTVFIGKDVRIDDIAGAFAHLRATEVPPTVD